MRAGADIIPTITVVREWDQPHRVAQSGRGDELRALMDQLDTLDAAFAAHELIARPDA